MYGKIKYVPNHQPVYIHIKILPYTKSYPQCPAGTKPCRNEPPTGSHRSSKSLNSFVEE
jgi:hypothetical protein